MANEQNLKPFNQRTESEQREIRSKGGKASGAARRRKRDMLAAFETLFSMPIAECQTDLRADMEAMGYDPNLMTQADAELFVTHQMILEGKYNGLKPMLDGYTKLLELKLRQQEFAYQKKKDKTEASKESSTVTDWLSAMQEADTKAEAEAEAEEESLEDDEEVGDGDADPD